MRPIVEGYFRTPLVLRILAGFAIGSLIGIVLWLGAPAAPEAVEMVEPAWKAYIEPFGAVFVNMLKMIVVPVIFFSLLVGAASLPISRFGRIGLKVIGWYFLCSVLAAGVGVVLALAINPGSGAGLEEWRVVADRVAGEQAAPLEAKVTTAGQAFREVLLSMFENPFAALASGNFLAIIVFAILFGLAVRVILENGKDPTRAAQLEDLIGIISAIRDGMFKMVDWILEYSPIGVLALSIVNFGMYGPKIIGPYVSVTLGVIVGILAMILVVYSLLLVLVSRKNPLRVFARINEAMVMAFMTRSSAATLPVSLKVAREELEVREELIFGGMLLSGKRLADLIGESLTKTA